MKKKVLFSIFLIVAICSACRKTPLESPYRIQQNVISDSAMVVTQHPLAASAGLEILKKGGNAVDAAVASQFALAVVHPRAGNIGGGGYMVIRLASGASAALDFREKAPSAAHQDMFLDSLGQPIETLSKEGHLSVGVPGTVSGLEMAYQKYSKLKDWKALLEPAIELAKEGFLLTKAEADRLNTYRSQFLKNNVDARPFVQEKEWSMGDRLIQADLAKTLKIIQEKGAAGFYDGPTAEKIVAEMQRGGGLISLEDLHNYQAKWRNALEGSYKNCNIITMPPSSSGGIALLQLLKILEHIPLDSFGFQSALNVHAMVEAEKRVYADRAKYLGDTDFYPVPIDQLLDSLYLKKRMGMFNWSQASHTDSVNADNINQLLESFETAHTSIVDSEGNAVSLTTTLNLNYGSKVIVQGAGFFLNDEMDDFSAKPGVPNYFGLVGAEANAIRPGKRMLSSMTPTIVEKNGELFMVLGAPGGSTIITAVLQTFLNVVEHGMDLNEAVRAPRFHHQWLPDVISCEVDAIDTLARIKLRDMGHHLKNVDRMALIKAIEVLPDGRLHGVADFRHVDDHAEGY